MVDGFLTGLKVSLPTVGAMFAVEQVVPLEQGSVSLVVAVSCTTFIGSLVWFISSKFQRISDRLDSIEKQLTKLPCENSCDCVLKGRKYE